MRPSSLAVEQVVSLCVRRALGQTQRALYDAHAC